MNNETKMLKRGFRAAKKSKENASLSFREWVQSVTKDKFWGDKAKGWIDRK